MTAIFVFVSTSPCTNAFAPARTASVAPFVELMDPDSSRMRTTFRPQSALRSKLGFAVCVRTLTAVVVALPVSVPHDPLL